jgi:hypothetical protein
MNISFRQLYRTTLRLAWLPAVAAISCSVRAANAESILVLQAFWSSGGPAPVYREVDIYGDQSISFRGTDNKSHGAKLTAREFSILQRDLASQELKLALSRMTSGDELNTTDAQAVTFVVASQPEVGYDMCSDQPAEGAVVKFLQDLNAICASHFTKIYRGFPLPMPCPWLHGPWDAPKPLKPPQ